MLFLLGAFVAGLLTVLAPCVLPLLPIIIGGSISGNAKDKSRPLIIAVTLAVSLVIFTILLKASTLLIKLPPQATDYVSGSIIVVLGILTFFPLIYARIIAWLGIEQRAQALLGTGYRSRSSLASALITGAALGPVFSSCSPVYGYILATILPANFAEALIYIVSYVVGLSLALLLIGFYGQRVVSRIRFASNPRGVFQRGLGILFILVGLLVFTGSALKVQTYVSNHTSFNFDALSAKLIPPRGAKIDNSTDFNVTPYAAPAFVGLQNWINSRPLTLKQLQAEHKVVLVDFWTYSCINCIRANVYTKGWYTLYRSSGFVVIGIHAPEFAFEQVPANVEKAVKADGITYPVALDNKLDTWNAFQNEYWPADYLIDASGEVRRINFGEGNYHDTEEAIRTLLQDNGAKLPTKTFTNGKETVPSSAQETPETYFGIARAANYNGSPVLGSGTSDTTSYTAASSLQLNHWTLGGSWQVEDDKIIARGDSSLTFRVAAKNVYLVGGLASSSEAPQNITVTLNGQPLVMGMTTASNAGEDTINSQLPVSDDKLYRLISFPKFTADSTILLQVPDGVQLNTFTFGS